MLKALLALCALVCLAPLSLVAQQAKAPPWRPMPMPLSWPPVTGLHVLSAVLNPTTHQIDVQLHNSSNKTVVAYTLLNKSYDVDRKQIQNSGIGWDFAGPDPNPAAHEYIKPGQTKSIELTAARAAATVDISVVAVIYLDRTYEGIAGPHFDSRSKMAKAKRVEASKAEGSRKKELEDQAAWLETQSQPVEGEKK